MGNNEYTSKNVLRLAVPSDGPIHEPALQFLSQCGMGVARTNKRSYVAYIPTLPGVIIHFQRGSDIASKVEDGSADLAIIGEDRFLESKPANGNAAVIIDALGFGQSEMVIGVPDSWVDVTSIGDLTDLSMEFRKQGADLKIATKYPKLVQRFLLHNGINYFLLVPASGTLEAAPSIGYADIIADITSTGVTMRENRLKTVSGGSIMVSEACLIANHSTITGDDSKLAIAESILEKVEAYLRSQKFYTITANISGDTAQEVASSILDHAGISGIEGPTLAKVYTADDTDWYAVTVAVEKQKLMDAVDRFRQLGASSLTVSQPNYVFGDKCSAVEKLISGDVGS